MSLAKFIYDCFLGLYKLAAHVLSLRNAKAKNWVAAQRNWAEPLIQIKPSKTTVWMHCASLGEYEQGRPVLEALKAKNPQLQIVLSFFSPSGYNAIKNTSLADVICYLPLDSKKNAHAFLQKVKPNLVLWVKYEFWHYYLTAIKAGKIPALLISSKFRKGHFFFKRYGSFGLNMLQNFSHIFVQDENSLQLLEKANIQHASIGGDTRFDRVVAIANQFTPLPMVEKFCGDAQVVVAGSTWLEDDEELYHYTKANPHIKFIIAPHEIDEVSIKEVLMVYANATLYSDYVKNHQAKGNVLIINNIGMLSRLYYYADVTYIGGGLGGDGVHNVLEAAVYKKPIIHGTEYSKYKEACDLVDLGAAFPIEDALELESTINELLKDNALYEKASNAASNYVQQHQGASGKVVDYIYENRLLIS